MKRRARPAHYGCRRFLLHSFLEGSVWKRIP